MRRGRTSARGLITTRTRPGGRAPQTSMGLDRVGQRAVMARPAPSAPKPVAASESGDLDLHALGQALTRKRSWIIVPTVLALVASLAAVNMITPRYKSEARILIDGRESVFLRP